jgi:hypothetical protein
MSSQLESIYSDELILLAETLGEVKTRTEKLEGEFSTHAKPLEAATNALSAALSGIKALQFHVLDNNLGALSARVEEMRKAVDEQVGVIALELKKADETNAAKAGADAEALRSEIVALQSQLGSLVTQFGQQLERVEFAAKEEAKKLQLIPGPAGAAGASLNPRGTFIDGEVYNRLDVVSWLGSSYIAAVDGVTEKPSKNSNQWQTLASRGGGGAGGVGDFGSLAGVAQINQGGTGQTTRALALNALLPDQAGSTQYMLLTDGSGTVSWGAQPVAGLPSQTSNSGRLLTTNGSTASWSNAVTVSGSNATVGGTLTVSGSSVGIGTAVDAAVGINSRPTITTGSFQYGLYSTPTVNASTSDSGFFSMITAASSAVGSAFLLRAFTPTLGSSSTITNAFGLRIENIGATGVTNAWGIDIAAQSGGSGTNVGLRNAGTTLLTNTTASTTTSSGALVVGNGTSGGLGVGGAINAGGIIGTTDVAQRITNTSGAFQIYKDSTPTGAARFSFNLAAANTISLGVYDGSSWTDTFRVTTTQALVTTTTASTSTSSGALVVSGGVGVAGAIYAGARIQSAVDLVVDAGSGSANAVLYLAGRNSGTQNTVTIQSNFEGALTITPKAGQGTSIASDLTVTKSGAGATIGINADSGFASKLAMQRAATNRWTLEVDSSDVLTLKSLGTTAALTMTGTTSAEFVGSIKTAAPSGGTAANWKLGTVASVSPTSPNRTIEVDIGGTIYYIHAKTTNN